MPSLMRWTIHWLLTGGEVANITQPKPLLDGLKVETVLADKDYDADVLIDSILKKDIQ